jgi:hypothetical protein
VRRDDGEREYIGGRRFTTPQGCRVTTHLMRNKAGVLIEAVTLEHPLELVEVAFGREHVLDRAGRRK